MRCFRPVVTLAAASLVFADDVSLDSNKRGLCYVAPKNEADDNIWGNANGTLTWYYNYQAQPTANISERLQFVPMLWGTRDVDAGFYDKVKSLIDGGTKVEYVLGFNEPDAGEDGGSGIDAKAAAAAWIEEVEPLKEQGVKLGAPAVTGSPRGASWLEEFYAACDGKCTTDFMPIHWYGNFEGMASWIGTMNKTYPEMTMWVTEFGLPQQNEDVTTQFFNQSVSYLDSLEYVTHYSWFGAFRADASNVGPNGALLTKKGKLTEMGADYVGLTEAEIKASSASSVAKFSRWSVAVVAATIWTLS